MIRYLFNVIFVALLLCVLSSCENKVVYSKYFSLDEQMWYKTDTMYFRIPPTRDAMSVHTQLGLRDTRDFPYKSVTVVVLRQIYNVKKPVYNKYIDRIRKSKKNKVVYKGIVRDTINCTLATDDGIILGKGVGTYQYDFDLKPLYLNQGDSVATKVFHIMARESLPGISDIGIVVKTKEQ